MDTPHSESNRVGCVNAQDRGLEVDRGKELEAQLLIRREINREELLLGGGT